MKKQSFIFRIIAIIASFLEQKFTLSFMGSIPSTGRSREIEGIQIDNFSHRNINVNVRNNDGSIIDRSGDPIYDLMSSPQATPSTLQQVIVSNTGSGAAAITAYFMNEDVFNATATNNGSGASSASNTYSDGWSGNGYNNLAKSVNNGRGIMCYGLTFQYIVTSGAVQDGTGLSAANPNLLGATNVGTSMRPEPSPLNEGLRNTQYLSGVMTVLAPFFMSSISQISYRIPVGDTVTLTVFCRPQGR